MSASLQLSFDLPVRVAREREDFLVAPSNQEAVDWIDRWPDWPTHALAVYGPAVCGKTHLAHVWRARSGASSIALGRLRRDGLPRKPGVGIVVENGGESFDEVALLHLYNAVDQAGGSLLLIATLPPAQWPVDLPDLRSRLRATTAVEVRPPDEPLLAAVMAKLFSDRQLSVTPELIGYVIARIERSFEAVHRCVERLDQAALDSRRAITVRLASSVLADDLGDESGGT